MEGGGGGVHIEVFDSPVAKVKKAGMEFSINWRFENRPSTVLTTIAIAPRKASLRTSPRCLSAALVLILAI